MAKNVAGESELRGELDALKADNEQLRADLRKVATSHTITQAALATLDDRVSEIESQIAGKDASA
jgi:chromosome segregation ATPase